MTTSIYRPSPIRYIWTLILAPIIWPLTWLIRVLSTAKKTNQNVFLQTNFAPLKEGLKAPLDARIVEGKFPEDLGTGAFYRTDGMYHWFDGDGMIHGVRITKDGTGNFIGKYVNHWIETDRWIEEKRLGHLLYFRIGWMFYGPGSLLVRMLWSTLLTAIGYAKKLSKLRGGTANTALEFHEGRLFSLQEASLPFQLLVDPDGWISSLGFHDFGGSLKHNMTAHPKAMPDGELRFIGYDFDAEPYCQYSIVKDGKAFHKAVFKKDQLPRSVMMHDFFVTTNYSIIMDFPLIFDMNEAKRGKNPLGFRKDLPARLGVFPKYYGAGGQGGLKWITVQTCYVFHTLNAWEQISSNGDVLIYLIASRMLDFSMMKFNSENYTQPYLWIVNYSQGSLQYEGPLISDDLTFSADFPRMKSALLGTPNRYGYFVLFDEKDERPFTTGVLKLDISALSTGNWSFATPPPKCSYSYFLYGTNKLGGECYFQPSLTSKAEDDGYLMTFIHSPENYHQSEFWIINAQGFSTASSVIAKISIPARIPFGFHAKWITEEEIKSQIV